MKTETAMCVLCRGSRWMPETFEGEPEAVVCAPCSGTGEVPEEWAREMRKLRARRTPEWKCLECGRWYSGSRDSHAMLSRMLGYAHRPVADYWPTRTVYYIHTPGKMVRVSRAKAAELWAQLVRAGE